MSAQSNMRGRGAAGNPRNRFERLEYIPEPDDDMVVSEDDSPPIKTQFFRDTTKSIIAYNDSPDIPFSASINPYRGCEHGCIYCYARPFHEYLGLSAGLDFETKIMVKENAPELLRKELMSPKWKPQLIAISGVTDCYQPAERKFRITRKCLEVLTEFRNPFGAITKNHLVARDLDLFEEMAQLNASMLFVSITTLDRDLQGRLEPRASHPQARLKVIEAAASRGIPVGVMVAPVIPGLTDEEMPAIVKAAAEHGATSAGYVPVRLPHAVAPLFEEWLKLHFPNRVNRVLNRVRDMRDGKMNDYDFGSRMHGQGPFAEQLQQMFELSCRRVGLKKRDTNLSTEHFRRPRVGQLSLFD